MHILVDAAGGFFSERAATSSACRLEQNWEYPGIYQRFAHMYLQTRAGFNTHVNLLVV